MVTSICVAKAGDLASGYQSVPQEAMCLAAIVSVISGEVCTMKHGFEMSSKSNEICWSFV